MMVVAGPTPTAGALFELPGRGPGRQRDLTGVGKALPSQRLPAE
jgi:hypothetical protein